MSKRKFELHHGGDFLSAKRRNKPQDAKKHSLDSDEEDEHDEANDELDEDDIEGEEDGVSRQVEGVRMTAFNMKEEMEEGHFDKEGHFIWNNEREIRDNWLDNVDWHNINNDKYKLDPNDKTLGEDSSSDEEDGSKEAFDEIGLYTKILKYMQPKETVNRTLRRLGGDKKLSSVERLKRKKAGLLPDSQDVADLTEYANVILTKTGNMNIYQETFEHITKKIQSRTKPSGGEELDMYADDFEDKEKQKIHNPSGEHSSSNQDNGKTEEDEDQEAQLKWEFKWKQDAEEIQGPYDTKQMIKWAHEGHFKTGVWVRKCGENTNFYNSNRIDFELYE